MSRDRTSQRDINSRQKQNLALEMRKTGSTLEQISIACGFGHRASAHRAIKKALAELPRQNAEELRTIEAMRLDELHNRWFERAKKDIAALHAWMRIHEARVKLFGLALEPTEVDKPRVVIREVPSNYLGLPPGEERRG